ncbi:hypothetical protein EPUS_02759 [Endocarpon pusillum Z07020]|uniref:Uncharacterized protein n=1 Tax=Endocarpon pusillum (strain Z07020 / HMAS-L-300199) TaxID=1263415 RepID=U1G8I0_ENDPU|nr:uncharacterized protein EPUS_02759 [Endocarpon pusillum Z07020]ERF68303.1 hypothetical protein EPUS_02759 [Endocarpon pusillum Z07020]
MGCGTSRFDVVDNVTSSGSSTDGLSTVQEEHPFSSSDPTILDRLIYVDLSQPRRQVSSYPREAPTPPSLQAQHATAGPSSRTQPRQSSSPLAALARGANDDSPLNSSSSSGRGACSDRYTTYFTPSGTETQGSSSAEASPRSVGTRSSSSAKSSPRTGETKSNSFNSLPQGEEKRSNSSSTSSSPRVGGVQAGSSDTPQIRGLAQRLAQTDLSGSRQMENRAIQGGQASCFSREGRPKQDRPSSEGQASQMTTPMNRAEPSSLPSANRPSTCFELEQPLFDGYTSDVDPSLVRRERIARYRPVADTPAHNSPARGAGPCTPPQKPPPRGRPQGVPRSSSSSSQDSGHPSSSRHIKNATAKDCVH